MNTTTTGLPSAMALRVREAVHEAVSGFTVPGYQVAWLCDGQTDQVAAGCLGLGRPDAVKPATRFPLGSVAKVFTASLALQLAGDDVLTLDGPIAGSLPVGACRDVLGDVSLRQLLTHTSGMENDHASEHPPRGSLREYVRACVREPLFPAGERFSYSSAGYVAVGHLIEAATCQTWAENLQAFLLDPLEVQGGFFLSEPLRPGVLADGHVRRPDGQVVRLAARNAPGREWAPAGGLAMSASALLRLVQLHLDGGRTTLGYPLLDAGLAAEMRAPLVPVPDAGFADAWGLGWSLLRGGPGADGTGGWFGHDGDDEGWTARVRASQDGTFAIVMLTNCLPSHEEWARLLAALASAGVTVGDPVLPEPPELAPPVDPAIVGSYEHGPTRVTIGEDGGAPWMMVGGYDRQALRPVDEDRCLTLPAGRGEAPLLVPFVRDAGGGVRYVYVSGRVARRAVAA
jgi:CubicO group peptidase (beta-lactamase class C family)